jgi:hypothetical protein
MGPGAKQINCISGQDYYQDEHLPSFVDVLDRK